MKNKILLLLFSFFAILPVYGDLISHTGPRYSLNDNMLFVYLLISVCTIIALLGACFLCWKKHEYTVPEKRRLYEWFISAFIFFLPYWVLAFVSNEKGDRISETVICLCTICGFVYEISSCCLKHSDDIKNKKLRHWAALEFLMLFVFYCVVLLFRITIFRTFAFSGMSSRSGHQYFGFSVWLAFFEPFVFSSLIFFFVLHRQKKRRLCYILLHFCAIIYLFFLVLTGYSMVTEIKANIELERFKKEWKQPEPIKKYEPHTARRYIDKVHKINREGEVEW